MSEVISKSSIKILPPRLANQIAAGEVVERPASVVKELVENSLDAGATSIRVTIEKGGLRLIRVTDNGGGIAKDELPLALSRHATSKISAIADLNQIDSLGFRGEALASISSVSRLTLTSAQAGEECAWQAYCEGSQMSVQVVPASHPLGSSVDVAELFYNTPARRKFLKSEKTEFAHIDDLIKRLALSRYDVGFELSHNGKRLRKFSPCPTPIQKNKRLAVILGQGFVDAACDVDVTLSNVRLSGWVATADYTRASRDQQFFFVNGRMIKDKVINHGIAQAFEQLIPSGSYPAYVLYLELEPSEVDVNVHPTKHEVRFRQARWIHDFISTTIGQSITDSSNSYDISENEMTAPHISSVTYEQESYQPEPLRFSPPSYRESNTRDNFSGGKKYQPKNYSAPLSGFSSHQSSETFELLEKFYGHKTAPQPDDGNSDSLPLPMVGIAHNRWCIVELADGIALIEKERLGQFYWTHLIAHQILENTVQAQPVLVPERFSLSKDRLDIISDLINRFDISLQQVKDEVYMLRTLPSLFKGISASEIFSETSIRLFEISIDTWLSHLSKYISESQAEELFEKLTGQLSTGDKVLAEKLVEYAAKSDKQLNLG